MRDDHDSGGSRPDPAAMTDEALRTWLSSLPFEEVVDLLVSYVGTYLRAAPEGTSTMTGPLSEMRSLSFAGLVGYLREHLPHQELRRFRVEGERVFYLTDTGLEMPITPTGERPETGPGGGRPAAAGGARTEPRPQPRPAAGRPAAAAPQGNPRGLPPTTHTRPQPQAGPPQRTTPTRATPAPAAPSGDDEPEGHDDGFAMIEID